MKSFRKFRIAHLFLVMALIALIVALFVERKAVTGQSSTLSPDGNWCLNLRLTEYSTLFTNRKILDADIVHSTNTNWNVKTSIPINGADARTISNRNPKLPIAWTEDSTTVNYWINDHLDDFIKIEANDEQHKFQRKLYSTTVTKSSKKPGR